MSRSVLKMLKNRKCVAHLPGIDYFYSITEQTIQDLPPRFKLLIKNLEVVIENFADEETLQSLNIPHKYDLLGLYRGIPVPAKTTDGNTLLKDRIFLYRCPLIRYAREHDQDIITLTRHVLMHEMGHHFGFSDYDSPLKDLI